MTATTVVVLLVVVVLGAGLLVAQRRRRAAYDAPATPVTPGVTALDTGLPPIDYDCYLHFESGDGTLVFEHHGSVVVTDVAVWLGDDLSAEPWHRRPRFGPGEVFAVPFEPARHGVAVVRDETEDEDCLRLVVELRGRRDDGDVAQSSWDTVWVD